MASFVSSAIVAAREPDPITVEVLRSRLEAIGREAGLAIGPVDGSTVIGAQAPSQSGTTITIAAERTARCRHARCPGVSHSAIAASSISGIGIPPGSFCREITLYPLRREQRASAAAQPPASSNPMTALHSSPAR